MKELLARVAIISVLGVSIPAAAQETANLSAGRDLALQVCAECHAVMPEEGLSPNAASPTFKAIANSPGISRIALLTWFQTPHKTMPNLVLKAEDADNLAAYIISLRDGAE